ncbi:hypothetical protein AAFM79_03440 [Trichormus azollae HNT15244]
MLFTGTGKQVGINMATLMPCHQLLILESRFALSSIKASVTYTLKKQYISRNDRTKTLTLFS